ncbi:MAG: helix-turn-helix domain-containing protein [Solirubrobacteraceae bacterium]
MTPSQGDRELLAFLATLIDPGKLSAYDQATRERSLSRTTLRALLVLAALPRSGEARGVLELANELGLTTTSTHRFLRTWVAVGAIEQPPESRQYRRVSPDGTSRDQPQQG